MTFKHKMYIHILGIYLAVMGLLAVHIAWPNKMKTFYVHPCENQYCVYAVVPWNFDAQISKSLPLSEAVKLTEQLNSTMADNWAIRK